VHKTALVVQCDHIFFFLTDREELLERFDYVQNKMKISHDKILQSPEILTSRKFRLRQRYEFLKFLGKAQFDETKPGYISFKSFVEGNDTEFILNVCKTSMETYDNFLKTL
jgi:mTERF domain-containing protein